MNGLQVAMCHDLSASGESDEEEQSGERREAVMIHDGATSIGKRLQNKGVS
jgi:hypothetical protein